MYKIGEFSKLVGIPVRTLRYYAEFGVLEPCITDNITGYKYYNDENVIECELIKLLKSLDFTLEEIKNYKASEDANLLDKKKKDIENRIQLLKTNYTRIALMQQELMAKQKDEKQDNKILRRKNEK